MLVLVLDQSERNAFCRRPMMRARVQAGTWVDDARTFDHEYEQTILTER